MSLPMIMNLDRRIATTKDSSFLCMPTRYTTVESSPHLNSSDAQLILRVPSMCSTPLACRKKLKRSVMSQRSFETTCKKRSDWSVYLAISALLLACSAMNPSSLLPPPAAEEDSSFDSGGWSPCNVRCARAHWASRASFPKSFWVVNAVCRVGQAGGLVHVKLILTATDRVWSGTKSSYLLVDQIVPGLSALDVSHSELQNIKRNVSDDAVEPDNSGPAPSATLDAGESPVSIHGNECRNL